MILNNKEINENIQIFAKDKKQIVAFARAYELPMPSWSCLSLLEKTTKVFSTYLLDSGILTFLSTGVMPSRFFCDTRPLKKMFYWNKPKHCFCLAGALISQNMFKQKYLKDIETFEQFVSALKDNEPGLFHLSTQGLVTV